MNVSIQEIVDRMLYVYFYDFTNDRYLTNPLNSTGVLILLTFPPHNDKLTAIRRSVGCLLWGYANIARIMSKDDNTVILQPFPESCWSVPDVAPMIFNDVTTLVAWAERNMLIELL